MVSDDCSMETRKHGNRPSSKISWNGQGGGCKPGNLMGQNVEWENYVSGRSTERNISTVGGTQKNSKKLSGYRLQAEHVRFFIIQTSLKEIINIMMKIDDKADKPNENALLLKNIYPSSHIIQIFNLNITYLIWNIRRSEKSLISYCEKTVSFPMQ